MSRYVRGGFSGAWPMLCRSGEEGSTAGLGALLGQECLAGLLSAALSVAATKIPLCERTGAAPACTIAGDLLAVSPCQRIFISLVSGNGDGDGGAGSTSDSSSSSRIALGMRDGRPRGARTG